MPRSSYFDSKDTDASTSANLESNLLIGASPTPSTPSPTIEMPDFSDRSNIHSNSNSNSTAKQSATDSASTSDQRSDSGTSDTFNESKSNLTLDTSFNAVPSSSRPSGLPLYPSYHLNPSSNPSSSVVTSSGISPTSAATSTSSHRLIPLIARQSYDRTASNAYKSYPGIDDLKRQDEDHLSQSLNTLNINRPGSNTDADVEDSVSSNSLSSGGAVDSLNSHYSSLELEDSGSAHGSISISSGTGGSQASNESVESNNQASLNASYRRPPHIEGEQGESDSRLHQRSYELQHHIQQQSPSPPQPLDQLQQESGRYPHPHPQSELSHFQQEHPSGRDTQQHSSSHKPSNQALAAPKLAHLQHSLQNNSHRASNTSSSPGSQHPPLVKGKSKSNIITQQSINRSNSVGSSNIQSINTSNNSFGSSNSQSLNNSNNSFGSSNSQSINRSSNNSNNSNLKSFSMDSDSTNRRTAAGANQNNILENFNWTNHSSGDSSLSSMDSRRNARVNTNNSSNPSSKLFPGQMFSGPGSASTGSAESVGSNGQPAPSVDKRGKVLTKNQVLAYKSFLNDINYVNEDEFILGGGRNVADNVENSDAGPPEFLGGISQINVSPTEQDEKYADYLSIAPSLIDGYTLISQLTSTFQLPNLVYHAMDDLSGEKVLIRMSPNYVETASISRFLNEWYMLSALNPPTGHRLYSNEELANDFLPAEETVLLDKYDPQVLQPITLPLNFAGVLYPMKILNIDHQVGDLPQKRMGLVFPDYDYKTLKDYHRDTPDILGGQASIHSGYNAGGSIGGTSSAVSATRQPFPTMSSTHAASDASSISSGKAASIHSSSSVNSGTNVMMGSSGTSNQNNSITPQPASNPPLRPSPLPMVPPSSASTSMATPSKANLQGSAACHSPPSVAPVAPGDRLGVLAGAGGASYGSSSPILPAVSAPHHSTTSGSGASGSGSGSGSATGVSGKSNVMFDEFSNRVKQPPKSPVKVAEIISDIISVLKTLGTIHELGIVHNGITSHNILKSTDPHLALNDIVLTGWDFCFSVQEEDCSNGYRKRHLTNVPELLPYISPEVTGEISSAVDYRSDFYSIGIVLYELVVGCLPFQSDNPSKLIRMHLLQKPISPYLIGSGWVSEKLSDVIMRLLEKDPAYRYMDCYALLNDLIKVKNEYVEKSLSSDQQLVQLWSRNDMSRKYMVKEEPFLPEKINHPPTFLMSNRIFGRTEVYNDLLGTYESMAQGIGMILIDGSVGVGKSTVLDDLRSSAISKYDFYVRWKFGRQDQDVSLYACFLSGMRGIIKQILASSKDNIAKWRDLITSRIKLDLSILFRTIPELKALLGPKYTTIYQSRRETKGSNAFEGDVETKSGDIQPGESAAPGNVNDVFTSADKEYSALLDVHSPNDAAAKLRSDDLELTEEQRAGVEMYLEGTSGVDDQSINLEVKIRYILKSFYELVGAQGVTAFWDDVQWCSAKEWELLNEIFEFFKVKDMDVSIKMIAVYGYDLDGEIDKDTIFDIPKIKQILPSEVDLHEFTLNSLGIDDFTDFVYSSFIIDPLPDVKFENTSMGSMLTKDQRYDLPFVGSNLMGPQKVKDTKGKDEELDVLAPKLFDTSGGSVLNLKYLLRGYYFSGKMRFLNNSVKRDNMYKLCQTGPLEDVKKEDIIKFYLDNALTDEARSLLKFAALIDSGDYFLLSDLLVVSDLPMRSVYEMLNLCIETKLIIPNSTYYKLPFHIMTTSEFPFDITDSLIWDLATQTRYRFCHDSIQSHLLKELADEKLIKEYQRLCGVRLFKRIKKETHTNISSYLVIATHLHKSWDAAKKEEYGLYFEALVSAARQASSTYNLETSLKFFKTADFFIPKSDNKRKLKSILTICQVNFFLKNFEECLQMIEKAEKKYGFDETMFLITRVRCLFQLHQYKAGLKFAIRGLRKLGVDVHFDRGKCEKISDKLFSRLPLSVPEIRKIRSLPKTTNPKILMIYELISDVIAPSYMCNMNHLRKALVSQLIILIHIYGISSYCAMGLLEFANLFATSNSDSDMMKAIELCKLALSLVDSDDSVSMTVSRNIYEMYVTSMAAFAEPIGDIVRYYNVFLSAARSSARLEFTSMATLIDCSKIHLLYLTGQHYHVMLKQTSHQFFGFDKGNQNKLQWDVFQLSHGSLSLDEYKKRYGKSRHISRDAEFCYLVGIVYWYCAHGLYPEASKLILDKAYEVSCKLPLTLVHIQFYFQCIIALTRNSGSTCTAGFALAKELGKRFQLWYDTFPANFAAKNMVVKASLNTINRSVSSLDTLDLYEEAIEKARENNAWHDVAQAHLLCATWLVSTNQSRNRAQFHAKNAYSIYKRLGADLMIARINKQCSEFFEDYNWAGVDSLKSDYPSTPGATATHSNGPTPLKSVLKNFFGDDIQELPDKQRRRSRLLGSISSSNRYKKSRGKRSSTDSKSDDFSQSERRVTSGGSNKGESVMNDLTKAIKACLTISESSNDETIVLNLLESTILFSEVDYGVVIINTNNEPTIQAIGSPNNVYKLENEPLSSRTDLCPFSLAVHCLHTGEIVSKDEDPIYFDNRFGKDDYYTHNHCFAMVCIPLKTETGIYGAVYLELQMKPSNASLPFFNSQKKDLLDLLCSQAAVSLDKAILYSQMEVAKRAAEDATAEKASFLANMSHEIRTPFNSLLSCSLFLLDTNLTRTQREYVETIKSSAMVTLSIIDGILAFSKIEHGSFTLDNAPFSLNECVESAIQLAGEQAAANDLELVYFNRCQFIDTIVGDVTRFRQIIINLVGNSVKFTSKGYIMVESLAHQIIDDRYEIVIAVSDTGIGIPDDSKSKVFGAFSQVDASSRRVYGGSGLGLAISKKLADIMNGTLTFESEEGKGSTFHFISNAQVNLVTEPEVFVYEEEAKKLGFSNRALIIDRHELSREALTNILDVYGLKATSISDMAQFETLSETYSIIFVHHNMLEEFRPVGEKLDKSKSRVILIAKFGKPLPPDIERYNIHSVLLSPYQRSKVASLCKQLKEDMHDPSQYSKGLALDKAIKSDSKKQADNLLIADEYPLRILLAEDNMINIKVALQHLKKMGYNADHAKDGVEVLEKCQALLQVNEKYDIILMDIQMPRKDGIAATIELKESFINQGKAELLPAIVALTANVAGADRERSLNCGMVDFISKPILPGELKRVLQNTATKIQANAKEEGA